MVAQIAPLKAISRIVYSIQPQKGPTPRAPLCGANNNIYKHPAVQGRILIENILMRN